MEKWDRGDKKEMNNEEREIDLLALCASLLRRWWVIVLVGLVCGGGAFGFAAFVIPPSYESTTAVYVVNKQGEGALTYSDLQMGTQLTKDYAVLTKSRTVMEQTIAELSLHTTVEKLKECITVSTASDTRILYITVTHTDPALAWRIADKVRELAAKHIMEVMRVEEINVAEYADYPLEKTAPSVFKWTAAGSLIGIFLTAGLLALLFLMDDKVKTPEDIETYLHSSVLGSIPYSEKLEKQTKLGESGKTGRKRGRK